MENNAAVRRAEMRDARGWLLLAIKPFTKGGTNPWRENLSRVWGRASGVQVSPTELAGAFISKELAGFYHISISARSREEEPTEGSRPRSIHPHPLHPLHPRPVSDPVISPVSRPYWYWPSGKRYFLFLSVRVARPRAWCNLRMMLLGWHALKGFQLRLVRLISRLQKEAGASGIVCLSPAKPHNGPSIKKSHFLRDSMFSHFHIDKSDWPSSWTRAKRSWSTFRGSPSTRIIGGKWCHV